MGYDAVVHYKQMNLAVIYLVLGLAMAPAQQSSEQKPSAVPKEVANMVGTCRGAWTMYGIDENGSPVKRTSWSDVITAAEPNVQNQRAFVSTVDQMTFEGGRIPPMTVKGTEGYFLAANGTLGDYFIEMNGQVVRAVKLSDNSWAYSAKAPPQELAQLNLKNPLSGQHTTVKVITQEDGAEVHHITRISTVNWKDAAGKSRWSQFVSLQGTHRCEGRPRN